MHRRRTALRLLLVFVACTGAAILISGVRPANDPGLAPVLVQVVGYLCGLAGGGLLLAGEEIDRRSGRLLLPALVALVLLEVVTTASGDGGADIGAGLVRLVLLVVIAALTARVARAVAADRPSR